MKKSHMLRTVLLSTVFALLTIVLMTPVASAHTAAPTHRAATATSQVPDIPNVDIITKDGRSEFSESSVDCHIQGKQPCLTITNRTHKAQEVDNEASTVVILQPGQAGLITATAGPGTYHVTLAVNDQATLDVIAS